MAMAVAAAACRPDPTAAPETTAVPDPGPGEPVVASAADPEGQGDPAGPETPAEGAAGEAPGETAPGETAPAAPAADAKSATQPLPAPLHSRVDDKCGRDAGVGTTALPFALKTADGKDISMASLRGKVVLLNFWGTWCKPCLKELPEFDRLVRHYRKHGAVLVAIATDTEPDKVLEFARERKIVGKLALAGEDLAKQYDSPNFPFSFVVDERGTIRGSYRSYKPECIGKIEQDIRTSLEQRRR